MRILLAALLTLTGAARLEAAVKTKEIEYEANGTKLKGFLAYDDAATGKRPGVIVFHEWWGLNDYAKMRAKMLAEAGYVAFCADMYGDGKVTEHPMEAQKFAGEVRKNLDNWLARGRAALKVIKDQPETDPTKVAAIGYCFGGTTALQLALAGEDLKVVAGFHAGLPPATADQAKKVKGAVLLFQGGADPFIPEAKNKEFEKALTDAGAKVKLEMYPGVTHSFTVEGVEKLMPQMKYDAAADKKSWAALRAALKEALGA